MEQLQENSQAVNELNLENSMNETEPKTVLAANSTAESSQIEKGKQLRDRAQAFDKRLHKKCTQLNGRSKTDQTNDDNGTREGRFTRFISKVGGRQGRTGLFSSVSIEPLAFLAILALYIEFPAIQDLIYTKICLQVLSNHPNITLNLSHIDNKNVISPHQQHPSTNRNNPNILVMDVSKNKANSPTEALSTTTGDQQQLPSGGRIQDDASSPSNVIDLNRNNNNFAPIREHSLCDRMNKSLVPESIRQEIIDGDSLFWLKYQIIICLLCAISAPHWGGISDKIGRIVPLNIPILAAVICNLISLAFGLLISMDSHSIFHINWLYSGALLIGLSGGQAIIIVNSFSFISDISSQENRSKRVLVLESVIYVSHSFGFYLNKLIMSLGLASIGRFWLNRHFVAFSACILLNIICLIYSALKLRHFKLHRFLNNYEREKQEASISSTSELHHSSLATISTIDYSQTQGSGTISASRAGFSPTTGAGGQPSLGCGERQRELTSSMPDYLDRPMVRSDKLGWRDFGNILTFKYYIETYRVATKAREARSLILLLLFCGFVSATCLATLMSLLFVYLKMDPFNWTTSQYSTWFSITSLTRGLALVLLTICVKFVSAWNVPDALVGSIGFLSKGVGLLMIALSPNSSWINWSLLVLVPAEFSMPPIRSLLSKLVCREELGKIYSALATIQSICFLFGNIAFYLAYNTLDQRSFFKITFIVVAGFQFSAVVIMLLIDTTIRRRPVII